MNETPPIIRAISPTVDAKTFQNFVRGKQLPNVWTVNVLNSQDLSQVMDYLRLNMKVSFGVGANNTLYIIDDSTPTEPVVSYYNLPLTISYNEYTNEVTVCGYFSSHKFAELDRLVKLELEKFNINAADELELTEDGATEYTDPLAQFLKQFKESDQPYADLTSWIQEQKESMENRDSVEESNTGQTYDGQTIWVQEQKESTETHEFFDACNTIWTRVTIDYKSPTQFSYIPY